MGLIIYLNDSQNSGKHQMFASIIKDMTKNIDNGKMEIPKSESKVLSL